MNEIEKLKKAICPDGSITDTEELIDFCKDLNHAHNKLSEILKIEEERDKYKKLSEYNLKKLKKDVEKQKEFKKQLGEVMTSMTKTFNDELYAKKQEELESYWHFNFKPYNDGWGYLYKFFEALKLYGNFCRRWEEHHKGIICVVERVRDTYLKPKIEKLIQTINENDKK